MSQPSQKEQEEPSTGKLDRPCVAKPFSCGVRSESDDQQYLNNQAQRSEQLWKESNKKIM